MHELALMESLVEAVLAHVGVQRVRSVKLAVGELAMASPDALRFCFDVCARGGPLEGAVLSIESVPGRARCRSCRAEIALHRFAPCACGSLDLEVIAGEELRLQEVEVV